jgi:hypothetical protein
VAGPLAVLSGTQGVGKMDSELIGILLLICACGFVSFGVASAIGVVLRLMRKKQFLDEEWDDEWVND